MADNNITEVGVSPSIGAQDIDQYFNAVINDFVPRNSSGSPEDAAGRLGTPVYQWDEIHAKNGIFLDGMPITAGADADLSVLDSMNYILNGSVRANYNTPNYLDPSGSTNSLTILGTTTPLNLVIDGVAVSVALDISVTGLSSAPASNNTALVNDAHMSSQALTKWIREIPIDNIGSEITSLNGKVAGFLQNGEYFLATVDTTNNYLLIDYRGSFLNSSGAEFARATIANDATITLMKTAWIFAENTGTGAAVSYTNPVVSGTPPTSPATSDYWYDLNASVWYVWSGSAWVASNRTLIGVALINSSGVCIAARAMDFRKNYNPKNTIRLRKLSATQLITSSSYNEISVYGNYFQIRNQMIWDITTDLDSGLVEASNTTYYFYITQEGDRKISDERPQWRRDLQGAYHPYKTWRCVGSSLNDGSSNLSAPTADYVGALEIITTTGVSYWIKPEGIESIKIRQCGAGSKGGGAGSNGHPSGYLEKTLDVSRISYAKCNIAVASTSTGTAADTTFDAHNITQLYTKGGTAAGTTPNASTATGGDYNVDGATSVSTVALSTPLGRDTYFNEAVIGYGGGGFTSQDGAQGAIFIDYLKGAS